MKIWAIPAIGTIASFCFATYGIVVGAPAAEWIPWLVAEIGWAFALVWSLSVQWWEERAACDVEKLDRDLSELTDGWRAKCDESRRQGVLAVLKTAERDGWLPDHVTGFMLYICEGEGEDATVAIDEVDVPGREGQCGPDDPDACWKY